MWSFSPDAQGKSYLAGQWQAAASAATFAVRNPATGAIIGFVPDMGAAETQQAIDAAKNAFPAWAAKTGGARAAILEAWAQLVRDNAEDLGELMTAEEGKPLLEAIGEVLTSADYIDRAAAEARKSRDETVAAPAQDATLEITRAPVGIVAAITPWNFPAAMVVRKLAPALAAGCPVILKPSEDTPLIALALAELAGRAGIPAGALSVVTGDRAAAPVISKALMDSPDVRKVSFTGSTAVGKLLMQEGAATVKRMALELGGNAPFIVLEGADVDRAVKDLVTAKFMNAGQMCVAPNRIYVHESLYDAFAQKLAGAVRGMKTGPGDDIDTQMGPLINRKAVDKVQAHVDDAVAKGAEVLCGGGIAAPGTLYFQATVLKGMKPDMLIKSEETFGPVAALFRFATEDEAVREANDTRMGLAAYVYGPEADARRIGTRLEAGMVGVNEALLIDAEIPFGGVKESGVGRENSRFGVEEYQEVRTTVFKTKPPQP